MPINSEYEKGLRTDQVLLGLGLTQIFCAVGFAIDLVMEFPGPRGWRKLSPDEVLHLVAESVMLAMVIFGFALTRYALTTLHRDRNRIRHHLTSLRGEFDRMLMERFARWNLTPAQKDVALLVLRGLRLSEIAAMRGSAEGTVKAHLNAVFRAANVHTRSELVGLFMEDFLDFGAQSQAGPC